ncbi:MAG: NAD(+) synthase, partial [Lysobacterales bacterium]
RKNGFRGAVLGLSGGIDSALTLAIAVDALGADAVSAVSLPSRYTAGMSNEDAAIEARTLGVDYHLLPIEPAFDAFLHTLEPLFAGLPPDTTEENIQARCRGVLLMALSNKTGRLVLTTSNKSETAVGYSTLYGDMAGGFAPIKDVPKTLVYRLAAWRNRQAQAPVIPQRVIDRPPSAELRPDQTDQDSLPPYDVLDAILEAYVERDRSVEELVADGFERATVERVARLVILNEYKRRQAAPGVRITPRAFGRDRRYPITSGFRR